jgi:hypothetical protein
VRGNQELYSECAESLSRPFVVATLFAVAVECAFTFWYVTYFGIPSAFGEEQIGILVAQIPTDTRQVVAHFVEVAIAANPSISAIA